ncbi:hypothetical protein HY68_26420, partial [Streptomyces sp. AcH 505]
MDDVGDGVAAQGAVDRWHELDPRVLLDLGDGGAQDLRHGDRLAPLPAGHGAAEHGEVLGVPADPGGQMVDVEEALEQFGVLDLVLQVVQQLDLPVDQRLKAPGQIDEDLDLLLVARAAGEPGRLYDGGERGLLRALQLLGQQVEFVLAVAGGTGGGAAGGSWRRGRTPGGHRFAASELLDEGAQFGLAAHAGAAQRLTASDEGLGGALGAEGGGRDGGEGEQRRADEAGPDGCGGFGCRRAERERHTGRAAQRGDYGGQHGGAQELGTYPGV